MKRQFLAFALIGALMLTAGCQTIGSLVQQTTTSTPAQVTTLGQAAQAADLVVTVTDQYVNSGTANRATLLKLQTLRAAVRKALDDLNKANLAGQSLTFAAFNTAYAAFLDYKSQQGITS